MNTNSTTTSKGLRWGPFTLRIPFIHIKFRAGEFFQGMVISGATAFAAVPVAMGLGLSFEDGIALSFISGTLIASGPILFGEPMAPGWITPALPIVIAAFAAKGQFTGVYDVATFQYMAAICIEFTLTKELTRHYHKHWNAWSIISQDEEISFYSEKHKYEILYLDKWKNESLKSERDLVICQNNVRTIHKKNKIFEITLDNDDVCYAHNIVDSRSTKLDRKYLKQHFLGQTIKVKNDIFDENKLVLMDFRVDQSKGIHFIYLVPFAKNKALIESTRSPLT